VTAQLRGSDAGNRRRRFRAPALTLLS